MISHEMFVPAVRRALDEELRKSPHDLAHAPTEVVGSFVLEYSVDHHDKAMRRIGVRAKTGPDGGSREIVYERFKPPGDKIAMEHRFASAIAEELSRMARMLGTALLAAGLSDAEASEALAEQMRLMTASEVHGS